MFSCLRSPFKNTHLANRIFFQPWFKWLNQYWYIISYVRDVRRWQKVHLKCYFKLNTTRGTTFRSNKNRAPRDFQCLFSFLCKGSKRVVHTFARKNKWETRKGISYIHQYVLLFCFVYIEFSKRKRPIWHWTSDFNYTHQFARVFQTLFPLRY